MKAGRELDALIAEKVFGKTVDRSSHFDIYYDNGPSIPFYSTRIAGAWLVVEKLVADGMQPIVNYLNGQILAYDGWHCCIAKGYEVYHSHGCETAPLAICLAALKACGVEVDG